MNIRDWRDVAVLILVSTDLLVATVYLFLHPSDAAFMTWGTVFSTTVAAYHFICVHDDKVPDANNCNQGAKQIITSDGRIIEQ